MSTFRHGQDNLSNILKLSFSLAVQFGFQLSSIGFSLDGFLIARQYRPQLEMSRHTNRHLKALALFFVKEKERRAFQVGRRVLARGTPRSAGKVGVAHTFAWCLPRPGRGNRGAF
jgi:hypothetical protein